MDMSTASTLYPRGELDSPPLATPLSGPRVISSRNSIKRGGDVTHNTFTPTTEQRRKHESYALSGSVFLIANGQTIKLPAASDSPADPLGWGRWRKAGAFFAISWFSIVALAVAQAAGIFLRVISRDFKADDFEPWQMDTLVTTPTLFMAFGSFLWIPLSIGMGRRPMFLLASVSTLVAILCAGYAQTFHELLACTCFIGLGEGFALTCAVLIVIDMTFIDERPKAIAILWSIAGFLGTGLVTIVPYISDHGKQWRPYYRYWSIPAMISVVLVFFLVPETYFKRPTIAFDGLIVLQTATEKLTVFEDKEADSDIYRDLPPLPDRTGLLRQFKVWKSPFASLTSMARCYPQMAFCIANPLIFWVSIAVAINYGGMMYIGTTFPRVLGEAPYNLHSETLSLVNLAAAVGGLLAYPISFIPVQKILDKLAKRNRGVREAEHYLVGVILPVLTGATSTLVYGLAVHYNLPLGVYFLSYGLNGFSWVAMAIVTTLWATEAFPRWAAAALAGMNGTTLLISYGLTFAVAPWTDVHGYKLVGIELTVLQIVSGLIAVPIAFWGKDARQAIHGRWTDERGGALRPL